MPFYFPPLQAVRHEALIHFPYQHASASHSTEVSYLLLEPVLCTLPVVYRRVGQAAVTGVDDILSLVLRVEEVGLASMQNEADNLKLAIS